MFCHGKYFFCYFIAYYYFLTFADFTEVLTFEVFAYSY